ncbi:MULTISPECIES: caspase family protein [unclassified Coleofasciculus]|uniref:caspase family protein n=1 Tax=unclassified Coleofasciculus TaxID=2692782 RepID=UPI00187F08D4|nr:MULTISPECIES: caspase family protein [unclassified Coleofasciculus]MBE9129739.1 caspase family protein [Coleofasciculus sp. LEGE 07081]MBE9151157.1 caspase family protein [Coleofasciculus sp. LEGE 07092]
MRLNRRTFLQKAGWGLAALGVSETVLSLLGDQSLAVPLLDRYFQALAQPGGRKLALLVGINQYPRSAALGGCITDVELQQELLMYRFGFNASDILTLKDSQATRESIETAFVEHLTKQAKVGDVVVFHFSGYGSRVQMNLDSTPDSAVRLQNSFVPVDGILPTKKLPIANDFLEETLALLLRSLPTDRVSTVLDTSHIGISNVLQGSLRVRSFPNPPAEAPSPDELAFQEQILRRLNISRTQLKPLESPNFRMPGLVLAAAGPSQLATEAQWNGFSAGLFTYALTQHLWQAAPATTVQITLSQTAGMVNQLVGKEQQPRLINKKSLNPLLAYYLPPDFNLGADGVVTAVEENGKTAQLWLAGLPATVLEYYGISSLLEPINSVGSSLSASGQENPILKPSTIQEEGKKTPDKAAAKSPKLQVRSKEGLTVRAQVVDSTTVPDYQLQVGQLVQESIRVLPRNLGLTVALDTHLQRIERVDATSAFASIPSVSSVVSAGEQPADYLFGRGKMQATPEGSKPEYKGGYGLFYLAREPIPNTIGEEGEAVKSAVNRLSPKFKTLLAAKLLRLTANEGSSRLGIRASLETIAPDEKVVMQKETWRVSSSSGAVAGKKNNRNFKTTVESITIPTLPIGNRIQYRLENVSDRPIYFMLLGIETNSGAIALYHNQSSPEASELDNNPLLKNGAIAPGEKLTLPQPSASYNWVIPGPVGLAENHLICSHSPFTRAIAALEAARRSKGEGERIGDLFNPLEVARALLQDLHQTSAVTPNVIGTVSDAYVLDLKAWATLSFVYQVV